MEALVYKDGKVEFTRSWLDPKCNNDEVLIAVETAGICSTDIEITKGYMGFTGVLGHEFVGTVVKGARDLQGKRVVGEINCVCGACTMCQSGLSNHCLKRTVVGIAGRDGAFAEYITLPSRNVHVVPDNLSNDVAVFVEPVAAALQISRQIRIESRDRVAVIGDGRLGLLVIQAMALAAAPGNAVLLGKHADKMEFCEKRGIQTRSIDDVLVKPEWDIVVDCSGSPDGFALATGLVRPRGTLVLKSTFVADKPVDLAPLVVNEITLVGSRCGPFAEAILALAAERIVVNGMITSRYKLAQGVEALEKARQAGQIKVILDVGSHDE